MFSSETYSNRRNVLKQKMKSGLLLFLGNTESPMNYPANGYHFRQDSTFLYYFGLDYANLAATIDLDSGEEIIYGDDFDMDDIIWMGPQPKITDLAAKVGIKQSQSMGQLAEIIRKATQAGRTVHFLPPYRAENKIKLHKLGVHPQFDRKYASVEFIKAVVAQRSIKEECEVKEIENALKATYEMHLLAMRMSRPGVVEQEIAGAMEGVAHAMGSGPSFPIIFSKHGETLHNHDHSNIMNAGDIVVNDCGAESNMNYCGDITRTLPIGGKFTTKQAEIYQIVLQAQKAAIAAAKPGIAWKSVHLLAASEIAKGLKDLGLMKGDLQQAVQQGAHAFFFQTGLGHMMGLDVHDMEDLGEQYVGYCDDVERSTQFGTQNLRIGRKIEPGFVLTVEPGIYFIPALIDLWKAENKFADFINYDKVEEYRDFGGIRIEDDILITNDGCSVLGQPIPKEISELQDILSA